MLYLFAYRWFAQWSANYYSPSSPSTWHTAVKEYFFFSDWISECLLPVSIHFQSKNLAKILDTGKNYFKIPTGQVILILSNLSKKYSFSASIVVRTLAVIKTISGSSRWLGSWKRAIKHHRQEGIYIFHIINCIGIKRSFGGQEEQNPKYTDRKT